MNCPLLVQFQSSKKKFDPRVPIPIIDEHRSKDLSTEFAMEGIESVSLPPGLYALPFLGMFWPIEQHYEKQQDIISLEVYSDRPFFKMTVQDSCVACSVGTYRVSKYREAEDVTIVHYISVVDVYDTYGLDIAYAYVRNLFSRTLRGFLTSVYTTMYIAGSVLLLDREAGDVLLDRLDRENVYVILLDSCRVLFELLVQLDEKQPKLEKQLDNVTRVLPDEILALIFRSKRVNKSTSQYFTSMRADCCLREGELMARSKYVVVTVLNQCCFTCSPVAAIVEDDLLYLYELRDIYRKSLIESDSNSLVLHSWRDYARIMQISERQAFENITSGLDLTDLSTLGIWILLILHRRTPKDNPWFNKPTIPMKNLTKSEALAWYRQLHAEVLAEYSK